MIKHDRLFCKNTTECPANHSCLDGKCVRNITPPIDPAPISEAPAVDED